MIHLPLLISLALIILPQQSADKAAETAHILRARALDYVAGYYLADTGRMDRALHHNLVKRIVSHDPKTGNDVLQMLSKATLLEIAKGNSASATSAKTQEKIQNIRVEILDIDEEVASVKVISPDFIDYLHMGIWNGEWIIINVFWRSLR